MVNCDQSWNDYRRTLYPKLNNAAGATKYETFASLKSESTRPDKLPTRILYPSAEGTYNTANVPKGLSPFTSLKDASVTTLFTDLDNLKLRL